ncbi:MAG TPA: 50S ribosomal protein L21e [Candidatus Paceibacterota bacterium]|nr:50S ribosomal protein L21e [Candidatus Paceibacterota bacterium]
MLKRKRVREKGKIKFSRYFQELKIGDRVSVVRDVSLKTGVPRRMQGRAGTVEGKRGRSYIIKINDYNQEKRFIIPPVHLKKLKT